MTRIPACSRNVEPAAFFMITRWSYNILSDPKPCLMNSFLRAYYLAFLRHWRIFNSIDILISTISSNSFAFCSKQLGRRLFFIEFLLGAAGLSCWTLECCGWVMFSGSLFFCVYASGDCTLRCSHYKTVLVQSVNEALWVGLFWKPLTAA